MPPSPFSPHQPPSTIDSSAMNRKNLFERAFSILKHDWVYDFFFNSQQDELDQLRYAVSKDTVATAELDITTLAPLNHQAIQINEHHRVLLISSFTTGNITVGFAVNEKITSSSDVVSRDRRIGRIARDDDNGTCLFISQNFNDYLTEVSFYSLISPAHRQYVFSLFQTPGFNSAMKKLRNSFDPAAFIPALVYCYSSSDVRPCPKCGANIENVRASCLCKLQLCRKRHPDDTEREMINIGSFFGGYEGNSMVSLYSQGKTLSHTRFSSRSAVSFTVDPSSHRRLVRWALCSTTQNRPLSPLAFCMAKGALGEKGISAVDTFLLASIADSVLQEQRKSPTPTACTLSLPQPSVDNNVGDGVHHTSNTSSIQSNRELFDDISVLSRPRSVLCTPALSESSIATPSKRSTQASLIKGIHPLASLLHPSSVPSAPPIVAPVPVPTLENLPHVQKNNGPPTQRRATAKEQPTSTLHAPSLTQDTLSQTQSSSITLSRDRGAVLNPTHKASVPQSLLPSVSEQPTEPITSCQISAPFGSRKPAFSQLFPQKLPGLPQVSPVSQPRPISQLQVPTQPPPPLRSHAPWQPQISLLPPMQRGSQPRLQPHMPLPPQAFLSSHGQLQTPTPLVSQTSVLRSQPLPSATRPQVTPLIPPQLAMKQPQQPMMIQPQHAPLIHPPRLSSAQPQQAAAMPAQQGAVPQPNAGHMHPHSVPPLRTEHAASFQSIHASSVLSQQMNGVTHLNPLRIVLDRSISASACTGSEVPVVSSGLSSKNCTSEERISSLRPAPIQARYILPFRSEDSGPVCGRVSKIANDESDERRVKAELRKARNRESAQRSNHKRKMRIQALKDDIAAAAKRELFLREKEKVLREENRSLRRTARHDSPWHSR